MGSTREFKWNDVVRCNNVEGLIRCNILTVVTLKIRELSHAGKIKWLCIFDLLPNSMRSIENGL